MPDRLEYAMRPSLVVALHLATIVLFSVGVDATGPAILLFAVPTLVLWYEAYRGLVLRPTLLADEDGIEVVVRLHRERHPWSSIVSVGVMGPPSAGGRLRRSANALEIDLGERLILIPGYRLGSPVAQVAAGIARSGRLGGTTGGF